MKRILFLISLLLTAATGLIQAQTFQVASCSGTLGNNLYGPMYSVATANAANRYAVIYPASQLGGIVGVPATNIYFHRFSTTGTMAGTPNFKIYLKEVVASDWGAGSLDWATAISGATLVFDGNPAGIVGSADGWKSFPMSTNFTFSGTQNLALLTEYSNTTASAAITWTYEYSTPCVNTAVTTTGKYTNVTTGVLPATLTTSNARRPYLGFDILLSCNLPTTLQSAGVTGSTADISWAAPATAPANGYEYYYTTSSTAPVAATTPSGNTAAGVLTASLSGLTAGRYYYYYVRSVCSGSDKSPWSAAENFSTLSANDDCATAVSLTQNATCTNTAGSTVGAGLSADGLTPCTGTNDDDVWFSFVANNTDAQIAISGAVAVIGTSTTTYFQVLSGSCGALSSIMCSTAATGIVGGLTPGETYYIRVYTSLATSRINFNICVNDLAAAPTVCTTLSAPATGTQVSTAPTLTWTATANASGYDIYLDQNDPPSTLYASRENGNSTSYTVSPSLSSGVYYWYVVPRNSLGQPSGCEANTRNFTAVDPPVNDDCSNATALIPSLNATCNNVAGTTQGATASGETAPTCSATGVNDDVWYSFVASATSHTVTLSTVSATSAVAIYSGTCGNLTQVACASTSVTANSLISGNTYYVRVYTTSATATTFASFNICIITPPVNNECDGALTMPVTPVGGTCAATAVSTAGATISTTTGQANSCTATGIDDDIWYTFTTTIAGNYSFSYTDLTAITGTASTVGLNIYTGNCGAFTAVTGACSSGFGTGGTGSFAVALGAASTYTLRLYVGASGNSGIFNFCITPPIAVPANDECSGAIALAAPSTTFTCSTPLSGTTLGATQSANTAPGCSATGINDDVWYSFVATSTAHTVLISNATSTTAAALYSGSCGTLTEIGCSSSGVSASILIPGNTYYVRVYTTSTTLSISSNFEICVVSGAPANDECGGAIVLTPSSSLSCQGIPGSTSGSTASVAPVPGCSATGVNDDVWYAFVATNTAHNILITDASSTTAAAVYSGGCGSLVIVAGACGSGVDGSAAASGLSVGQMYYVRVYTTSTTGNIYSTFNICITSGTPANDNCAGAQPLAVSADNSCSNAVPGTTLGATQSVETVPSCSATGINDDVWYSFVATATTHTVTLVSSSATSAIAVFSGSCGALTQVTGACASTNTVAAGLTPGNTYYIRVYTTSTTTGNYANFSICVGVLPANDNCGGALPLIAAADGTCNAVFGNTSGATATTGETAPSCSATGINDDVWYLFTATATTHLVSITNTTSTMAASIYSGSCSGLTEVTCASTTATATGLTIGNTYYVRVYTTTATVTTTSSFNICVSGIPSNNECATATTLTANIPVNGNTTGASQSQAPEACGTATASAANDVWYQFTALSSGSALITINNVAAVLNVVAHAYSGACGSLVNIGCADGPGDGGTENIALNGLVAGQTYYIRVHGFAVADVGTFTINVTGGALPVSIQYFRGNKQTGGNLLQWKLNCVASPSSIIDLQKSSDGSTFENVHTEIATDTRCQLPFQFIDGSVKTGATYYRLKITDANGVVAFSNTVVILNKASGIAIAGFAPNPVRSQATLTLVSAHKTISELIITDILGKQVKKIMLTLVAGDNQIRVPVAELAPGLYQLSVLTSGEQNQTTRFLKQ